MATCRIAGWLRAAALLLTASAACWVSAGAAQAQDEQWPRFSWKQSISDKGLAVGVDRKPRPLHPWLDRPFSLKCTPNGAWLSTEFDVPRRMARPDAVSVAFSGPDAAAPPLRFPLSRDAARRFVREDDGETPDPRGRVSRKVTLPLSEDRLIALLQGLSGAETVILRLHAGDETLSDTGILPVPSAAAASSAAAIAALGQGGNCRSLGGAPMRDGLHWSAISANASWAFKGVIQRPGPHAAHKGERRAMWYADIACHKRDEAAMLVIDAYGPTGGRPLTPPFEILLRRAGGEILRLPARRRFAVPDATGLAAEIRDPALGARVLEMLRGGPVLEVETRAAGAPLAAMATYDFAAAAIAIAFDDLLSRGCPLPSR